MIRLVLDLLVLFNSGAQFVSLPGTPVAIQQLDEGLAVACVNPSAVCIITPDSELEIMPYEVLEPRDMCMWSNELVVSDFAGSSVLVGNRMIPVPGNPDGTCEVNWNSSSASELAVALFDPGIVVLVEKDGSVSTLVEIPAVKSLSACDAEEDGDMDLFASGCGSGVFFIENVLSIPNVHYVGNIRAGVKRCCAVDMDGDGLMDVAGIACAEGGAGWWRNPGDLTERWIYTELEGFLEGPKGISCIGDSLIIVSLFSDVFFSSNDNIHLPPGFTCCYISSDGYVFLGHKFGFLLTMSVNGGFV